MLHRGFHYAEVFFKGALSREPHFVVDVVVGAGDEDSRFLYTEGFDKIEILFVRAYPAGDLGEFKSEGHAFLKRAAILFGVDEEFGLADDAVLSSEAAHQLIQIDDLLDGERRGGLLPVAEGGIRDPNLLRHIHRHKAMVERYLRHRFVIEKMTVEIRRFSS